MREARNIAVVLLNLGGPDKRESIKPFLFNFFMDANIIPLKKPFRWMLAKYISITRSRGAAGTSYARLGNKSPLLENTQAQAGALAEALNAGGQRHYKIHVAMRYWHPLTEDIAAQVAADNPDRVILLPLYPQFSTTTTWSSLSVWQETAKALLLDIPTSLICCYPGQDGFIKASADLIAGHYAPMKRDADAKGMKPPRLLFSAHGLPEDVIHGGDPYQWQCEKSAEKIAAATGIENLDWQVCYQSRVGPKKWIGPSTDAALRQAADDAVPVLIYPHAFTQEHVETLVEIEEEYRHLAQKIGVPLFGRVPTVGCHEAFIEGLAAMVRARVDSPGIASDKGGRVCPAGFTRCCMGMDVELEGARRASVLSPQTTL